MIQRAAQPASRGRVLDSETGMMIIRRHLSWLLSAWLVCQVTALAAPVVLASSGAGTVEELCTCAGGDHESCPMHHGGQPDTQDPGQTGVGACRAPLHVALLWMAGGAAVLPNLLVLERPNVSAQIALATVSSDEVVSPHSTPPPRFQ